MIFVLNEIFLGLNRWMQYQALRFAENPRPQKTATF
jgi:hypothetical protein